MRARLWSLALPVLLIVTLSACGNDDGAGVRVIDGGSDSSSASGSASGSSASEPHIESESGPLSTAGEPAEPGQVIVQGFRFQPAELTVAVGAVVTWLNEDDINHTVSAGTPDEPGDAFDLPLDEKEATATYAFDKAGTYDYFCRIHNSMRGQIVVS